MKFESSNIYFHEIIKVWTFPAKQITTKNDLRCFQKPGPDVLIIWWYPSNITTEHRLSVSKFLIWFYFTTVGGMFRIKRFIMINLHTIPFIKYFLLKHSTFLSMSYVQHCCWFLWTYLDDSSYGNHNFVDLP